MVTKAFALNRIHRRDANGESNAVPAGKVFDSTEAEFKILSKLGAVRAPTKDEVILDDAAKAEANGTNVKAVANKATADKAATDKAAADKAAADKAAADKAAADKAAADKAAADKAAADKGAAQNDPNAKPVGKKSDDLVI